MADPIGVHSDGELIFGSQVLTINAVAYIAESITTDQDTKVLEAMNEVGVPNKQLFIEQVKTASATLQLAATGTVVPPIGGTVPIVPVGGGSAINFLVKKVGEAFQQDGETKVTIDMRKKLN